MEARLREKENSNKWRKKHRYNKNNSQCFVVAAIFRAGIWAASDRDWLWGTRKHQNISHAYTTTKTTMVKKISIITYFFCENSTRRRHLSACLCCFNSKRIDFNFTRANSIITLRRAAAALLELMLCIIEARECGVDLKVSRVSFKPSWVVPASAEIGEFPRAKSQLWSRFLFYFIHSQYNRSEESSTVDDRNTSK